MSHLPTVSTLRVQALHQSLWAVLVLYLVVRLPVTLITWSAVVGEQLAPPRFRNWVDLAFGGGAPLQDALLAHPPAALLLFALPYPVGRLVGYDAAFAGLMLLFDFVTVLFLALSCKGRFPGPLLAVGVYSVATLNLWPLLLMRYDIAIACALAAALLWHRRWSTSSGAWGWLGLAAALKGAAIACVPLLALDVWRRSGWPVLRRGTAALMAGILLPTLPILALSFSSLGGPIRLYADRGLHIESPLGSLLLAIGHPGSIELRYGAMEFVSSWSDTLAHVVAPSLQVAALLLVGGLVLAQRRPTEQSLPWIASLLAVLLFSKVLSPQYLLWLAPLIAALPLPPRRYITMAALFGLATLLTTAVYPVSYRALLEGAPFAVYLLAARNGTLLAMFGLALVFLWNQSGAQGATNRLPSQGER